MPWSYECRQRLLKQFPAKPTKPRLCHKTIIPGPTEYDTPILCGGKGYSHIRRAPAYSFGMSTPISFSKPPYTAAARLFDVCKLNEKGSHHIPNGIIAEQFSPITNKTNSPGPTAYKPKMSAVLKRPPAYSLRHPAKPPYEPWDMWTPGPNMYHPPIFKVKKMPAYSFKGYLPTLKRFKVPDPGAYDADYKRIIPRAPAYSFAPAARPLKLKQKPDPNAYCEKKFNYVKRRIPAFSFGIKHSPYRGEFKPYLLPSTVNVA